MTVVSDYTAILTDYTWAGETSTADTPTFITYSFEEIPQEYLGDYGFRTRFLNSMQELTEEEKDIARAALAAWAEVSGIVFIEVDAGEGDIKFGSYNFMFDPSVADAAGFAYYGGTDVTDADITRLDIGGDVFIDDEYTTDIFVYLHEIGHALGFKHTFDDDPVMDVAHDDQSYTVMSYTGSWPSVLGPFDVEAVQHVYGSNDLDTSSSVTWSYDTVSQVLSQTGSAAGELLLGISVDDIIAAGEGSDTVASFEGNDQLYGQDGDDRLDAGAGNDFLHGGAGADRLEGDEGSDILYGDVGFDTLEGGDGDDQLYSSQGGDALYGGQGNDTYIVGYADNQIIEYNNQGTYDLVRTLVDYTLPTNVELLYAWDLAGFAPLALTGNSATNLIAGNAGNNVIDGRGGSDYMAGLGGNDTYLVGEAGDIVDEGAAGSGGTDTIVATVSVNLSDPAQVLGEVEYVVLQGTSDIYAVGNVLTNFIQGNSGANYIDGQGGVDYLQGLGGDDYYVVDDAQDFVDEAAAGSGGYDTIVSTVSIYLPNTGYYLGDIEGIWLGGTADLFAVGNGLDNGLTGNVGNNHLDGGEGSDYLAGGDGADTFHFTTTLSADNVDWILDFSVVDDLISLGQSVFSALASGDLLDTAFWVGDAAQTADQHIIYDDATGALYYDTDGTGVAAATQFAWLATGLSLTSDDFFVA